MKVVLNRTAADSTTVTITANDGAESSSTTITGRSDGKELWHSRLLHVRFRQLHLFGHSFLECADLTSVHWHLDV